MLTVANLFRFIHGWLKPVNRCIWDESLDSPVKLRILLFSKFFTYEVMMHNVIHALLFKSLDTSFSIFFINYGSLQLLFLSHINLNVMLFKVVFPSPFLFDRMTAGTPAPAKVSWAVKMVSQFGTLGYTNMGKTADLTVVIPVNFPYCM